MPRGDARRYRAMSPRRNAARSALCSALAEMPCLCRALRAIRVGPLLAVPDESDRYVPMPLDGALDEGVVVVSCCRPGATCASFHFWAAAAAVCP